MTGARKSILSMPIRPFMEIPATMQFSYPTESLASWVLPGLDYSSGVMGWVVPGIWPSSPVPVLSVKPQKKQ